MTEDEILAQAEKIQKRREYQQKARSPKRIGISFVDSSPEDPDSNYISYAQIVFKEEPLFAEILAVLDRHFGVEHE